MSKLPTDEAELFREAMRDVRRQRNAHVVPQKSKPTARAQFSRADQRAVLRESLLPASDPASLETGDELSFRRDDVTPRVLRRLRSGEFAVGAELDLHGLTAAQARIALRDFVAAAVTRGIACIRVVHGKGRGSGPRGPVLKNAVNVWLRQCEMVRAFGSARAIDGGNGAAYVLLKKPD